MYVINGAPRSGKSTFVSYCLEDLGAFGSEISTVDFIKDIAKQCGWDGIKTPANRRFLSDLKDLLTEWQDIPFKKIKEHVAKIFLEAERYDVNYDKFVVFVHCREPHEIDRLVKHFDAKTILVRRLEAEEIETSNHADAEIMNYNYDIIIQNNRGFEQLREEANDFLKNEGISNII